MADDTEPEGTPPGADAPEDWPTIAEQLIAGIAKHYTQDAFKTVIAGGNLSALGGTLSLLYKYGVQLAVKSGQMVHEGEDVFLPVLAGFVAPIVAGMFGSDINPSAFATLAAGSQRNGAAQALADAFARALEGDGAGEVQPGRAGAMRVASASVGAALEGWFQGAATETLLDFIPLDIGHLQDLTKLPEDLIRALGVGRLVRRALAPLVNAVAAEPMRWDVNKRYSPTLLAASTALRAFTRGRWDWADVTEELARDGYNETRMEELYNEQRKFLTVDDLADMLWLEILPIDEALQTMKDAGYDEQTASKHLNLRKIRHEDTLRREIATAAITAFVDHRIDGDTLGAVLDGSITGAHERDLLTRVANSRRALSAKPLTAAEAEAAVIAGVLAFPDYRDALARENRTDDAITVLDILLRIKVTKIADAAQHRADIEAERAAAAQARADAVAAKKAEIDAARQLKAQGPIAELEHAVVVGLIPLSRLTSSLSAQFDADTVAIYVADVTQKRAAYLAQQQKQADAAKRAANKGLNTGELAAAVYDGIIPLETFTTLVKDRGLSDADAAILTATVQQRKADLDLAKKKRAEADLRATNKKISLNRAETLVLLGHWPMASYASLLASLGFDEASQAALVDLLQTQINARADGTSLRQLLAGASPAKALTLEQFRKAVIAGDKTIDDFSAFLRQSNYAADAQAVLIEELRADVAGALAAQLRRSQGDTTSAAVVLPLVTARKAARLGTITPAAYRARLVAGGYSAEDIALEMDLLTAEMTGHKKAAAVAGIVAASPASKGLTLQQLASAVKSGTASLEDYRGAAAASGLPDEAINTLVADLTDALAVKADAKNAHTQVAATLAEKGVTLTDLEDQVRAGSLTVVALEAQLVGYGYSDAEAQLVGSLLTQELAAPGGA